MELPTAPPGRPASPVRRGNRPRSCRGQRARSTVRPTWVTRCFSLWSTKPAGRGFIPSVAAAAAAAAVRRWRHVNWEGEEGPSSGLPAAIAGPAAPEMRPHPAWRAPLPAGRVSRGRGKNDRGRRAGLENHQEVSRSLILQARPTGPG